MSHHHLIEKFPVGNRLLLSQWEVLGKFNTIYFLPA